MKTATKQNVGQQLAALSGLGVSALRQKYLEVFGEPSRSGNKAYLFKKLAWRIKSLAEGGLSERARVAEHDGTVVLRAETVTVPPAVEPPTLPGPLDVPDGPLAQLEGIAVHYGARVLFDGLRAAREVGLDEVPAVIRELNDEQALELAIVENVQRADLTPIEEAAGYERLIKEFKRLPGIGQKSAQRIAFHVMRAGRGDAEQLAQAILDVKDKLTLCTVCNNISDALRFTG